MRNDFQGKVAPVGRACVWVPLDKGMGGCLGWAIYRGLKRGLFGRGEGCRGVEDAW